MDFQQSARVVAVGVGVIITRGDEVLLLRRCNVHGHGAWSTPGGHMDFGETPAQCAIREAGEETGLLVSSVRFRALTNDVFEDDAKHYITIWMEASRHVGEPRLMAEYESSEMAWFKWAALPEPLFRPLKNLIEGRII